WGSWRGATGCTRKSAGPGRPREAQRPRRARAASETKSWLRLCHSRPGLVHNPTVRTNPRALMMSAPLLLAAAACDGGPAMLTRAQLMDPTACMTCHPQQYSDWSRSMHAYASDDPVFAAMNARAQRETGGALGDFCVKCHAPVAVAEGLTHDGTNLAALPAASKGVTCFFCHSANAVDGTHNNPLVSAKGGALFG